MLVGVVVFPDKNASIDSDGSWRASRTFGMHAIGFWNATQRRFFPRILGVRIAVPEGQNNTSCWTVSECKSLLLPV